ncbi:hypothetical protein RclHR1_07750002 [Rhizophagus clarus]|uniref:Zinc finger BED domain-containing protein 1-like n=1 Tax=Rhizophagus clarus TaxID=94130 RepID=A0A2Z6S9Q6_9GLOM|nr:hypothetical protein RclHR1_07750002 [Rhizophagus clarus]GES83194.1 zinc finger BED domain-containing protein 1-like [Rhizophagus clarus]
MSRGRPSLADVRQQFEPLSIDLRGRSTPRQRCRFCGSDVVDLIDRLKEHLIKCVDFPANLKESLDLTTSKFRKNNLQSLDQLTDQTDDETQSTLDKVDIDRKLAKFFYSAGIPFTAIENPYWLDFIQTILPAYNSPNRRNLANNLLDAEYQVERQNLDKVLNNASNITLVSDGWSNIRRESVLNFILCLPKPIFYDAKYTGSESHTAEYIYNEFKSIIEDIGPSKFAGVLTDNASAMRSAWKLLNQDYPRLICLGCNAHIGNLLIKDILKLDWVERSMNQAKQIVNFFRTHHQAESILLNQLNTITLVQPVETRWGTCLDSIQSIRRCKLGLQMSVVQPEVSSKMTHDLKEQILGDLLWANLEALDYFLTPFVKLIRLFESDTPLLSYIYEEWRQIRESINAQVLDLNFKMKVHRLIDNRFEFAFHPAMAIANLLDPNFHGKSLGPTDFKTIIIPYIEKVYTFEEAAHIYGVMQKYIAKTDEFSGALLWASIEYSSPISWWKSNFTHKFPVVVELACRVLSIPTSSAAAERNWSNFGFIHSKLRARLNNNRVKKLVAIYQNLRIHKEVKEDNWFEEDEV